MVIESVYDTEPITWNYVKVKAVVVEGGTLPAYKRVGDACMDCYSRITTQIEPGHRALVPLGFLMELPFGYEGVIRPRSGLTSGEIDEAIGTIDSNYRGEVKGCIINNSSEVLYIEKGDRICQLAIREAPLIKWDVVEELSETERGANGFGSSGVK